MDVLTSVGDYVSNKVEIKWVDESKSGRGLFAKESVKKGELILVNQAYVV